MIPAILTPSYLHSLSFPISADGIFEAEGEKAECGAVLPNGKLNEQNQEGLSYVPYDVWSVG
jgi:hypothetical protein